MKYRVIISDPPWKFSDSLSMSDVKRGAESVYNVMSITDIKALSVKDIAEDDSVLLLWCPSSLLAEGLDVMKAWGFRQTQTHIWVKTKQYPLKDIASSLSGLKWLSDLKDMTSANDLWDLIRESLISFDLANILAFGMGRLFRQTHELVLVGVRGKIYPHLENKSQRSVHFFPATKHSTKPEALQDMLDKMFTSGNKLEMFARRDRVGWTCVGLEASNSLGEDIRDSIERLKNL